MRHSEQHTEKTTARTSHKIGWPDLERGEYGNHIGQLKNEIIILRVRIVFGSPAPARVDGDDAAFGPAISKCWRQRVKIRGCTRKPRQANNRNSGRSPGPVFAHVEP